MFMRRTGLKERAVREARSKGLATVRTGFAPSNNRLGGPAAGRLGREATRKPLESTWLEHAAWHELILVAAPPGCKQPGHPVSLISGTALRPRTRLRRRPYRPAET